MEKNKNLGILFIVLSAFSFAWMSTFVRLAGDLPSVEKSFFRNLVAVGVAAFTMIRSKEKIVMGKGNLKFLILRALFGTIGILGNFYAIDHLVLSDANMLNKMSPFFVILFSYLILKEDLTLVQGICVAGAFIGSLFIIKPTFANANLVASLAGLCGGIAAGAAYSMVRVLGQRKCSGSLIIFFFSAFSCLREQPRPADSSVSRQPIFMRRRGKYRSTTIPRSYLPRSSDSSCLARCRMRTASLAMW